MARILTAGVVLETGCIIGTCVWDHLLHEAWPDPLGMSPGVMARVSRVSLRRHPSGLTASPLCSPLP
jgi:hypothetical protein